MDPSAAVGHRFAPEPVAWNRKDLMLYALGLGVTDDEYTFENNENFGALPTFPLVLRLKGTSSDLQSFGSQQTFKNIPGLPPSLPLNQMLHGEQSLEILANIPIDSTEAPGMHLDIAITGVYDKGTQMQIVRESVLKDAEGKEYAKMVNTLSVIGMGGFGGDSGPPMEKWRHPAREADVRLLRKTFEWQNLLYRLSGDANPVHASHDVAKRSGWHAPTFQGMATFAIAGIELGKHYGSPESLKSIKARFVQPVFPGETLEVIAWDITDNRGKAEGVVVLLFQVRCPERDVVILSNGVCHLEHVGKKGHYSKL
jgi:peroxisomal enoyl-CoA hydratase 2